MMQIRIHFTDTQLAHQIKHGKELNFLNTKANYVLNDKNRIYTIWIKLFYRKYDYNYYEIFILLLFLSGMQMLMFSFLGALESITKTQILSIGANIVLMYAFWAIAQFFDKRKILNYLKAPISCFLGLIIFIIVALVIGFLIDLIK